MEEESKLDNQPSSRAEEVMVFDMSTKPKAQPPKIASRRVKNPDRPIIGGEAAGQDDGVEILVSLKDKLKIEERQNEQARMEFDNFKRMMDKVIGSDETYREPKQSASSKKIHKGGELVNLDDDEGATMGAA